MTGLWMITGNLRSGKTLMAVWLAKQHHDAGKRIFSNFHITFAEDVLPAEILMLKDLQDCTIVIDELWTLIDSRSSVSGENKFLSDIILGSGKDGVTIIGTSQMAHMVDKRYRDIADYIVLCERRGRTRDLNAMIRAHITVQDFRAKHGIALKTKRVRVGDVASLYDTTEKIQSDRHLLIKEMGKHYRQDHRLMERLQRCETTTDMRDIIYALAGVKRSNQILILQELGMR